MKQLGCCEILLMEFLFCIHVPIKLNFLISMVSIIVSSYNLILDLSFILGEPLAGNRGERKWQLEPLGRTLTARFGLLLGLGMHIMKINIL